MESTFGLCSSKLYIYSIWDKPSCFCRRPSLHEMFLENDVAQIGVLSSLPSSHTGLQNTPKGLLPADTAVCPIFSLMFRPFTPCSDTSDDESQQLVTSRNPQSPGKDAAVDGEVSGASRVRCWRLETAQQFPFGGLSSRDVPAKREKLILCSTEAPGDFGEALWRTARHYPLPCSILQKMLGTTKISGTPLPGFVLRFPRSPHFPPPFNSKSEQGIGRRLGRGQVMDGSIIPAKLHRVRFYRLRTRSPSELRRCTRS